MACWSLAAAIAPTVVSLVVAMFSCRGGKRVASSSQQVIGRSGQDGGNLSDATVLGLTTRDVDGRASSTIVSRPGTANCEAGHGLDAVSVGRGQTCAAGVVSGRLTRGGQRRALAFRGSETENRTGLRNGLAFSGGLFVGLSAICLLAI